MDSNDISSVHCIDSYAYLSYHSGARQGKRQKLVAVNSFPRLIRDHINATYNSTTR
jgi:hypothetical protein